MVTSVAAVKRVADLNEQDITLGQGLVRAGPREHTVLGEITSDAFRDDPFNRWLFGNYSGIRQLFHLQARRIYSRRGYCYTHGDEGACMWMLPGGDSSLSRSDYWSFALRTLIASGPAAIRRGVRTGEAMAQHHLNFPHAYLFSIGVRPSARGTGLGRKLIQPVLEACDRENTRAYLENSNPENSGFYSNCGFVNFGEAIHPEPESPPLQPMVREPRRRT